MLFLQSAAYDIPPEAAFAGLFGLIAAFFIFFMLLIIGTYIFSSFAYMSIARKTKYKSPGIAWIPIVGPALISSKAAKMHWWPVLLLIGAFIPFVGGIFSLVFTIFMIIWTWKTFEVIGKPNWWAILLLIPIVNFIILGIAAWSKK